MSTIPGDDDGNSDVGTAEDSEVAEGSNAVSPANTTTSSATSWTSYLSPSSIIGGVQNVYSQSALRVTGAVQALTQITPPSPSDFWESAKNSGSALQNYVRCLLAVLATYFNSSRFTDVASAMTRIVSATATFRNSITGALEARHVSFETLTGELEVIFMGIVNNLRNIPRPAQAPTHAERVEMVDRVLDDTAQALTQLVARYGIPEEVVTAYLFVLRPQVRLLTVAIGDINEQYPQLFPFITFSVAILLIPESWILRPFLSVFGFGPAGPIKGSAAAWMQSYFWGAAVEAGSWFSWLQAAGMGAVPKCAGLITKTPLLVGRLAMLLRRSNCD